MFKITSKHRSATMGVAAIIIVVHHYLTSYLGKPYRFGAVGVDMFMFTMGLGLYFSLYNGMREKSFIKSLPSFFWRRFKRIMPTLAVFLLVWSLWKYANGGFTYKDFWLNLSLTGYWTLNYGKYFNWFVSGLLIFYLSAPLIFYPINKLKNKIVPTLIIFAILSVVVYSLKKPPNGEINRTLIMIVRLIPMCFGMIFGAYCKETPGKIEKRCAEIFFGVLFVIGIVFYIISEKKFNDPGGFIYGYRWYSFGLIAPMMCVIISYLFDLISRITKIISCVSDFFGKISFEIYLTHILIIENILPNMEPRNMQPWFSEPQNFIFAFFLSTLFAYVLSLFADKIDSKKKQSPENGKGK